MLTDIFANFLLYRSEETLVDILEVANANSCVTGVYGNKNHGFSIFWLSAEVFQHICKAYHRHILATGYNYQMCASFHFQLLKYVISRLHPEEKVYKSKEDTKKLLIYFAICVSVWRNKF